jgi:NAD(P)-dependent dehydrogenase (short-subunit alcohol dehydrogenase family)
MATGVLSPFRSDLFEGRVALVTGGATGLGFETCRVLGRRGARVALCSRKESNPQQAVASLREEGIDALYRVCDVRQADAVGAAVESVLRAAGGSTYLSTTRPETSLPSSPTSAQMDSRRSSTSI